MHVRPYGDYVCAHSPGVPRPALKTSGATSQRARRLPTRRRRACEGCRTPDGRRHRVIAHAAHRPRRTAETLPQAVKQLKDKDSASVGKNATLQAENRIEAAHEALEPEAPALQEHSEKARLTYQRRSTAEAAGVAPVRAAEEFCRRAEDAEERTREALQENAELRHHVKQLTSALTLQGKQITFSGNAPRTPKDALESYLASEDVLGVASPSPVQARSPNVHDEARRDIPKPRSGWPRRNGPLPIKRS